MSDDHLRANRSHARERGEQWRSRTFVGRGEEMSQLTVDVTETLAGHGRLVLLAGEPGIGKTSLAEETATYAAGAGMQVLWGRCDDTCGAPPYWPWVQMIRSYLHDSPRADVASLMGAGACHIAQLVPEALAHPVTAPPLDESDRARFQLFDSIGRFLGNAAKHQPLLVVLDDLHAADKPSLLLLQFLTRHLSQLHVMGVAAYRDVEVGRQHPLSQVLGELVREPVTRRLTLRGLSVADVQRYIELSTGTPPTAPVAAVVYAHTEGNPFFVGEVVRMLVCEGRLDALARMDTMRFPVPQGVREVTGRRLGRLSSECNRVLALASVMGREFSVNIIERVDAVTREHLLPHLEEAVAAGVIVEVSPAVGRFAFHHTLFRETLYRGLSTAQRIELHHRVGDALEAMYRLQPEPHLAALAHHFFEAAPGGGGEKAIRYSLWAADHAAAQMAHEEAARYYDMALQIMEVTDSTEGSRLVDVLLLLSDARWRGGGVEQAKHASLRAIDVARHLGAAEQFARAALGLSGRLPAFSVVDRDETAIALLEEALHMLEGGDTALQALVMARLAEEQTVMECHEQRWALARRAIDIARRIGDPKVVASVLKCTFFANWNPLELGQRLSVSDELVRLAEQLRDRRLALEGRMFRFVCLVELGDTSGARRELDICERAAQDLRQPYHEFMVGVLRGCLAFMEGRLADVEPLVQEALRLGERARTQNGAVFCGGQLARLMWLQGRFQEIESLMTSVSTLYPFLAAHFRAAFATTYAEQGRLEDARIQLDTAAANGFTDIPRHISWQADVAFLAEACAVLGDAQCAERLYELLRPLDGRHVVLPFEMPLGPAAYYLGILAAVMDRWESATHHFENALQLDARTGARQHLARTQVAYAQMLMRRGLPVDQPRVVDLLQGALAAARKLGMARVLERATAMLATVGARASASAQDEQVLTSSNALRVDADGEESRDEATVLFRQEGEYWTIAQHDRIVRLKHVKGFQYLTHLLRHPGREFHALDLVSATATARTMRERSRAAASEEEERALNGGRSGALLDQTAKIQYRQRLAGLREQLDEAERFHDAGRADALRSEMASLTQQLAAAVGLGGRDRNSCRSAERARWAVTKGLKSLVNKIRIGNPVLGRHLATHIRTGYVCSYSSDPDRPIRWVF